MKVTFHGVVTTICLLGLVLSIKLQGVLIQDQNKLIKSHVERLLSRGNVVQPGMCIRPMTATLERGPNNTMVFTVRTCGGKTFAMVKNFDIGV